MKNLILLIFAVVDVRNAPAAITPSEAPEGPKEADGHMAVEHRASVPLPATPQIEVSLVDGSRLVGTTTLKEVMLKSTTMYEADKVTLPDEDYQLYIRGWQPANTWRVRNTTVR